MAGPSGAGMVQAYLRMSRSSGAGSRRREYLTALRRETAKIGRGPESSGRNPDLVEYDCLFLCMSCGHLSEPRVGDPMRSEAQVGPRPCGMCGASGLVDLRQTPMVHSLSALESTDINPSRARWVGKTFGVLGVVGAIAGMIALFGPALLDALDRLEAGFMLVSLGVVASVLFARAVSSLLGPSTRRRTLPRRWRMPRRARLPGATTHGRVRGQVETASELLRAPLSGRPCVAYEVAVRDDADASASSPSWRLLEQDSVGFRVNEVEVAPGEALLKLRREPFSNGVIGSENETTRRFMRTRGLLASEDVFVYETILAPGAPCTVSRRDVDAPVLVRG
ncbi:MAG TPA: hypothetical protein VK034_18140 [Enhygromyxa sp.]|nr:hypothetical protein [Enhygromyxa sp.]